MYWTQIMVYFLNFQIYLSVLFIFPMLFWITYEVKEENGIKLTGRPLWVYTVGIQESSGWIDSISFVPGWYR